MRKFLPNLESGGTIGYMSDLGNFHEVFTCKTKHRVYGEQREFLGNYKAGLGKEEKRLYRK